jgi:hypothetical protein
MTKTKQDNKTITGSAVQPKLLFFFGLVHPFTSYAYDDVKGCTCTNVCI